MSNNCNNLTIFSCTKKFTTKSNKDKSKKWSSKLDSSMRYRKSSGKLSAGKSWKYMPYREGVLKYKGRARRWNAELIKILKC